MSQFFQRSQRSIELPLGCKDLFDVEAIRNWVPREFRSPAKDQLAHVEGYIARVIDSAQKHVLIGVGSFRGVGHVHVLPDPALALPVVFASWNNAKQEVECRTALEDAGAHPAGEGAIERWKHRRALKYFLPINSMDAAGLIGQIFRAGYGLVDSAEIIVWHRNP